jgi:glycine betaine/proline transport system ATP-binding protein
MVRGVKSPETARVDRSTVRASIEVEGLWKVFEAPGAPAGKLATVWSKAWSKAWLRARSGRRGPSASDPGNLAWAGPAWAMAMAAEGATRAEILATTGRTVGVRDVSFDVGAGETFVVMGLSGSGKSTLVRCVSRLIEPSRGTVRVDGDDITAMNDDELREVRRSKMSMVFQNFGLLPHRRVIDNVAYGLEVQGMSGVQRRARAMEVIETVGLTQWAQHFPQQLSGGMQQRVGLARALAVDPSVLFFDEPFSALDPLIRRDMQSELLRLQAVSPRTIVFITHDFDEALRLGDRIAIMKDGVFDQIGTPEELVASPATDYVKEFTQSVSKVKVLTARSVLSSSPSSDRLVSNGAADRRRVLSSSSVATLIPMLLESNDPIAVTSADDDRQVIGHVDRERVLQLLATEGGSE